MSVAYGLIYNVLGVVIWDNHMLRLTNIVQSTNLNPLLIQLKDDMTDIAIDYIPQREKLMAGTFVLVESTFNFTGYILPTCEVLADTIKCQNTSLVLTTEISKEIVNNLNELNTVNKVIEEVAHIRGYGHGQVVYRVLNEYIQLGHNTRAVSQLDMLREFACKKYLKSSLFIDGYGTNMYGTRIRDLRKTITLINDFGKPLGLTYDQIHYDTIFKHPLFERDFRPLLETLYEGIALEEIDYK